MCKIFTTMGTAAGTEKSDHGEVAERPKTPTMNAACQANKPEEKEFVADGDIVTADSNDRSTYTAPDEGEHSYSGCTEECIRSARQSMSILSTSVGQLVSDKIIT
jgi:hypothetical protein